MWLRVLAVLLGLLAAAAHALSPYALPVFSTAKARLKYKSGMSCIEVLLCNSSQCSRMRLHQTRGTLQYITQRRCNLNGRNCDGADYCSADFLTGDVVLELKHMPNVFSVWREGHPDRVAEVEVGSDYDTLRVGSGYETDVPLELYDIKGYLKVGRLLVQRIEQTSGTSPSCFNGGNYNDGACECPLGFGGPSCETACGPGRFGTDCDQLCSEKLGTRGRGCSGVRICSGGNCTCATGWRGSLCDQVCPVGQYGADCSLQCGQCANGESCDPYTGECLQGCLPGYNGASCQQEVLHFVAAPNITAVTSTSITCSVRLEGNTAGSGEVAFIALFHREYNKSEWTKGCIGELLGTETYNCSFDGLRPNTTYLVQALLLNEKMEGVRNVPYVSVRTPGQRALGDVVVSEISATSFRISWTSPNSSDGEFFITYQCEALLACPGEPCEHLSGAQIVFNNTVLVKGLVPFASYRVAVSRDGEMETTAATTGTKVPDVGVSSLEATHITNETAVVRWGPPRVCAHINGPIDNFRWQLFLAPPGPATEQSGYTNNMFLVLRNLKPSTEYELQVSITNALGGNPENWSSLLFNTSHTVPDAPRQLAVYRLNATSMWVRWKVPERPSGEIRGYVVSVQGAGSLQREVELVSPSSVCPAWPDLVCHRVDGLQPHKEYTIAVSAINEYGDKPGEAATVKRTTELGVPDPPKNLLVVDTLARSLVIQWQLPDSINADLSHFDVLVTPTAGRPRREEVAAIEEQPVYKHSIINLTPNTTYKIGVRCGWNGGEAHLLPITTAAA